MSAASSAIPFVMSAPSGTGKTTVVHAMLKRDSELRFSVSHTTRQRREGEQDGVDYHFVSKREFRELREKDVFVEHAEYGDRLYGTSWAALQEPLQAGHDVLLEIEVQGARQLRVRLAEACFIFLLPPDMAVREQRLRERNTDSDDAIEGRLAMADNELAAAEIFDYAVVNDDLGETIDAVLEIVRAERTGDTGAVRKRYDRVAVLERWYERNARC